MKIKLTDNAELRNKICHELSENGGYCPCRLKRTENTKCMCKEFRDAIEKGEPTVCHCGLYEFI